MKVSLWGIAGQPPTATEVHKLEIEKTPQIFASTTSRFWGDVSFAGKVGIGTANPDTNLDVGDGTGRIVMHLVGGNQKHQGSCIYFSNANDQATAEKIVMERSETTVRSTTWISTTH